MEIFLIWLFLSVAAGMFAAIHRNRNGVGWFFVAIIFSPLVAFVLLLILQPSKTPRKMTRRQIIVALEAAKAKEAAVDPRWANLRSTAPPPPPPLRQASNRPRVDAASCF